VTILFYVDGQHKHCIVRILARLSLSFNAAYVLIYQDPKSLFCMGRQSVKPVLTQNVHYWYQVDLVRLSVYTVFG